MSGRKMVAARDLRPGDMLWLAETAVPVYVRAVRQLAPGIAVVAGRMEHWFEPDDRVGVMPAGGAR